MKLIEGWSRGRKELGRYVADSRIELREARMGGMDRADGIERRIGQVRS